MKRQVSDLKDIVAAICRASGIPDADAAPGRNYRAVLFDICMSKVAAGKIELARAAEMAGVLL